MMRKLLSTAALACGLACAQETTPPTAPPPGSLSGRVTVSGTGTPMANVEVSVNRGSKNSVSAVTDAAGRYSLRGLDPGQLSVLALAPASNGRVGFGPRATRQVYLQPGQELTGFDFQIVLNGQIVGKVFDQNREPVVDATVYLVVREYVSGVLRAVFAGAGSTDDQGDYVVERVRPDRPYILVAQRRTLRLDPISDEPSDPRLRLPAVVPTFYPNSRTMEGAQALVLGPGERREGVNIQLVRSPSYCVQGGIAGGTTPADLRFEIRETQPTSGHTGEGGFYTSGPGGSGGADGKLRICGLHPGDYELSAQQFSKVQFGPSPFFGSTTFTVTDRDLDNVRLIARPRLPLSGEVVWDGPAPDPPLDAKLTLAIQSLSRTERGNVQSAIPGEFEFKDGVLIDDYDLTVRGVPKGVYIKEIGYGDRNILHEPLRMGRATGNGGLRVVLSRNGGTLSVRVADKDGNPVPECSVVVMPSAAPSDGAFAAALATGITNQGGTWVSSTLAPGKYYVLATSDPINKSPETIAKLLAARGRAEEVTLEPGGSPNVTLAPKGLE